MSTLKLFNVLFHKSRMEVKRERRLDLKSLSQVLWLGSSTKLSFYFPHFNVHSFQT